MAERGLHMPRLRDIVAGIVVAAVALTAFVNLGDVVKLAGAPFLLLPSALGITRMVTRAEISQVSLASTPSLVAFPRAGRYAVYTSDYDLLTTSDTLEQSGAPAWLTIRSRETGTQVPATLVHRGLRPYDTFLARGRPVITFTIPRPGIYELIHPAKPSLIFVLPDYTTGREKAIVLACWAQVAAIAVPLSLWFGLPRLSRRQTELLQKRKKRDEAEAAWQRMIKRGPGGQDNDRVM